jgi:hypothetical protein
MSAEPVPSSRELALNFEANPLHFSDLKHIARSPAHFLHQRMIATQQTRSMRIGSIVHRQTLGIGQGQRPMAIWPQTRRHKGYAEFVAKHPEHDICTGAEVELAQKIADAIGADALATEWLEGTEREVPLTWHYLDIKCATRGVDFVKPGKYFGDLKSARSSQPDEFERQAWSLFYPAQLAWYEEGLDAVHSVTHGDARIISVESTAPYPVVCRPLTAAALEQGRKCISAWMERLLVCLDADEWPGYAQGPVALDARQQELILDAEEAGDPFQQLTEQLVAT